LIEALHEAVELEHILLAQYLYAAASLKAKPDLLEGPERFRQFELIRRWKRSILQIAREEMQHLTYAINMLVAVGGAPTLARSNFPSRSLFFAFEDDPKEIKPWMALCKFGRVTLKRFILFESDPEDASWTLYKVTEDELLHPENFDSPPEGLRAPLGPHVARIPIYKSVKDLYEQIRDAFLTIPNVIVNQADQVDVTAEVDATQLRGRKNPFMRVSTPQQAAALCNEIIEQGEGSSATDPKAHRQVFIRILSEYDEEKRYCAKKNLNFSPAQDVLSNPQQSKHKENFSTFTENPEETYNVTKAKEISMEKYPMAHQLMDVFNGCYGFMITWLLQYFGMSGSNPERSAIASLVFMPFMTEVIQPLLDLMTQVQIGGTGPFSKNFLGASFETSSAHFLLPYSSAVTEKLQLELLQELHKKIRDICTAYPTELAEVLPRLEYVGRSIQAFSEQYVFKKEFPKFYANDPTTYPGEWESEISENPSKFTPSDGILRVKFRGWFQVRLGTDPDHSLHQYGCTGNTFAFGKEPRFDRSIHFQPHDNFARVGGPNIGVNVYEANYYSSYKAMKMAMPTDYGTPVPDLVDAHVDLLEKPIFAGRNWLLSLDGEPVNPFHVAIKMTKKEGHFDRKVKENKPFEDETVRNRSLSFRFPTPPSASPTDEAANWELVKKVSPNTPLNGPDLWKDRLATLKKEVARINAELEKDPQNENLRADLASAEGRIWNLETIVLNKEGGLSASVQNTRLAFRLKYSHTISGEVNEVSGNTISALGYDISRSGGVPDPWLVTYYLCHMDSDALCAMCDGELLIPVVPRSE
jgi:rubrerythrin